MDELVKRLRTATTLPVMNALCQEAADAIEGLSHAVEQMTEWRKNQWIPVTERLPDIADMVLVCSESGLVIDTAWRTAFSIPSGAWDTYSGILDPASITHWMPLPEQPKEGE